MEGQEEGQADHTHPASPVESLPREDSRQPVVRGSYQSEQCDHVWEVVQGIDHSVNGQDSLDSFFGHS